MDNSKARNFLFGMATGLFAAAIFMKISEIYYQQKAERDFLENVYGKKCAARMMKG